MIDGDGFSNTQCPKLKQKFEKSYCKRAISPAIQYASFSFNECCKTDKKANHFILEY